MTSLTKEEFDKKLERKEDFVVKFFAAWCGPCVPQAAQFDKAIDDCEISNISFYDVDIEKEGELVSNLGIRGVPSIILLKDGEEAKRLVGLTDASEITENINLVFG